MPIVTKGQVIRLSQPLRGLVRTPWAARAVALDGKRVLRITLTSYAATWSEAMQAAQVRRAELDRALMDEIHAEPTTRRKTKEAEDIHTMEATA